MWIHVAEEEKCSIPKSVVFCIFYMKGGCSRSSQIQNLFEPFHTFTLHIPYVFIHSCDALSDNLQCE